MLSESMSSKVQIKDIDPQMWENLLKDVSGPISHLSETEKPDIDAVVKAVAANLIESIMNKNEFKGFLLSPGFTVTAAQWQYENLSLKKDDVLIVSYPKTGTTWMREIVRQLLYKGNVDNMNISKTISPFYNYVEFSNEYVRNIYDILPLQRKLYSTHYCSEMLNMDKINEVGCKILYIMRNPKDTLVSWYHFIHGFPVEFLGDRKDSFPKDWSQFFENFVTGQQADFCKKNEWYPHHILSWYKYRDNENFKLIFYEDIKQEPENKIAEISEFLGCNRNSQEILEIVKDTSFASMKKQDGFERVRQFRKGVVGDWKNYFTVTQSEIMDEKFEEVLSGIDVKFRYE